MPLKEGKLTSYTFKVIVERDKWPEEPDTKGVWRAYIPPLEHRGAHAWGDTPEQALENLRNAMELLLGYMKERGEPLPEEPEHVQVSQEPLITVTV